MHIRHSFAKHPFRSLALLIVSVMLLVSTYTKFAGTTSAVSLFDNLNLLPYMKAFALVQIIILLCLWCRSSRHFGLLLASAYFGAGIVMLLSLGQNPLLQVILLFLIWAIALVRRNHCGHCCDCGKCSLKDNATANKCNCGKPGCRCKEGACPC
ncbi:hypothetical protein IT401_00300 [Candidatus Nomurabacteria bacterium]|nr:hypothetical protein [Candidatus Nomurabacteria bacterium]